MGRFGRDADQIRRDLFVAMAHPDYRDQPTLDALRDLRRRRRR